ncbi:MarR family winged helix-turn-helix transcriptional regulator [Pelagibacterium xiamenense]|uniref:MarR family winged helix-turn-helix transcriptional regulator n=1 Tax=Pelagibacterium xiamenense TaxID=2901140 RepID=UPI001E548383|nr:MarR family winged helix-turn-helix transcriptional regulator [Pelagibacterium xiamenense]MCD7059984.1 MarR family winged helix-turn-helix transcriptional regulator [Pelagibacterium xiamenense]
MTYAFFDCLVLNTVMAARALTRRYDKVLRPFGISVVQFTVLMTVRNSPRMSVNAMAARISMDRTTLLRNLEPLRKRELVVVARPDKGNVRHYELTEKGADLLEEILPLWRESQVELRALVADPGPEDFLSGLRALTAGEQERMNA